VSEASERFLQMAGVPLLRGRAFTAADVSAVGMSVWSTKRRRTYFGSADPVGLAVHLKYLQRPPLG